MKVSIELSDAIVTSVPTRRGGVLMLPNTRFPVAQILAEIADGGSLEDICDDFNLPLGETFDFMRQLAKAIEGATIE